MSTSTTADRASLPWLEIVEAWLVHTDDKQILVGISGDDATKGHIGPMRVYKRDKETFQTAAARAIMLHGGSVPKPDSFDAVEHVDALETPFPDVIEKPWERTINGVIRNQNEFRGTRCHTYWGELVTEGVDGDLPVIALTPQYRNTEFRDIGDVVDDLTSQARSRLGLHRARAVFELEKHLQAEY